MWAPAVPPAKTNTSGFLFRAVLGAALHKTHPNPLPSKATSPPFVFPQHRASTNELFLPPPTREGTGGLIPPRFATSAVLSRPSRPLPPAQVPLCSSPVQTGLK